MPSRESAPLGAPCWVDLMTTDVAGARAFYAELFGWSAEEPDERFGGYFNFAKDGALIAGGMAATEGPTDVWSVYLAADDAQATVNAAVARGATTIVEPLKVMDLGTMAVLSGPDGGSIGLWEPGTHKGFGLIDEHGAPRWFELHSHDYDNAVPFYREVFGWEPTVVSDEPNVRLTAIGDGERQLAGIIDADGWLPADVPSHWAVYFGVDDTDAAAADVQRLGGSVARAPLDTPYGRTATVADPNGAVFNVVGPAPR
jgi:predicted enzyme related to lactoylglutathione lyase